MRGVWDFRQHGDSGRQSHGTNTMAQRNRLRKEASVESLAAIVATDIVSCVVAALVASVVATVKAKGNRVAERTERERATDEAVRTGMRELLWSELKNIHEQAMEQRGLAVADRKHLEGVYAAYHGLGGNGTGTRLYTDAMNQPVID